MQGHVDSERLVMPIRRTNDGRWRYRHVVQKPDGTRERINGSAPTHLNTKVAAERAMLDHIERVLHPERVPTRKETPTFADWFDGRFWTEWVIGRRNKPSEMRARATMRGHADSPIPVPRALWSIAALRQITSRSLTESWSIVAM